MSLSTGKSGLNRTNFDNKTDRQARKILAKHYNNLGMMTPQFVSDGVLTTRNINKIVKDLNKRYDREIKKENKVNKEYMRIRDKYNRKVDRVNEKVLEGRTELEKQYIRGEEVFIPKLMNPSFHSDSFILRKIGKEQFSDLDSKKERTKELKKQIKKLDKVSNDDLFSTIGNYGSINFLIQATKFNNQLSDAHFNRIWDLIGRMSEFELELFTKMQLNKIIEKYLGVLPTDDVTNIADYLKDSKTLNQDSADKMFNRIVEGIYLVMEYNRGEWSGV